MKNFLLSLFMPILPKRLLSRLVGLLTRIRLPWPISTWVIGSFAKAYNIRLDEAERPLSDYSSVNAFFTRRLKDGIRPVQGEWVHPADAVITQGGRISQGQLIQAKGWNYSLRDFLGDGPLAQSYEGGSFATYYLCPTDYHRVHAPMSGQMYSATHIPGQLWPVNEWSVRNIESLFCLNERVVLNFRSQQGHWSVVLVGATNVGQITIPPDPSIWTNRWMWHASSKREYNPPLAVKVGSEIGVFNMGSTVVCVYSDAFAPFNPALLGGATRVGQKI